MGTFDNELILPGTSTEIISDFDLGYDTSLFGTTDAVAIIGTAFNGPVGRPVEIYSPEHANYIFGEAYDYTTRREATLVASIKDAWEKGCKTIYAVRVSGKDIAKDFSLVPETKLKLRVSGLFPSNANKEISMVYDNSPLQSCIKIYKPAKRATIKEKSAGLVDRDNSILENKIELFGSYGIDSDSRLVDLIRIVNEYPHNNVIRLSIVDENGNDVTIQSKEAQALSVGAMFPGLYLVGRDESKEEVTIATDVQYRLATEETKPYETFTDKVYKELVLNTDASSTYPIYGSLDVLNEKLPNKIYMTEMFDFLMIPGAVDIAFNKDSVDYEEVELSDFDLYTRLGSGFAITARAELAPDGTKIRRITETPSTDERKIVPIKDGIYSMLEGLNAKYRVLTSGYADTVISGKLPRKAEFVIAKPKTLTIGDVIDARSVINPKDFSAAKSYQFKLEMATVPESAEIEAGLYFEKVAKAIDIVEAEGSTTIKENSLVVIKETMVLGRVINGEVVALAGDKNKDLDGQWFFVEGAILESTVSGDVVKLDAIQTTRLGFEKEYVLVENASTVYVYKAMDSTLATLEPVGSIDELLNGDDDKTLIIVESVVGSVNTITVKSNEFDYITVEELIEKLNSDATVKNLFSFTLKGLTDKDIVIEDILTDNVLVTESVENKEEGFDEVVRIPYRTTDNFARQLAQHCTYTSLKTAPTHGIIGCGPLMDINLTSVANKVNDVMNLNLSLYAKKDNGRDMLDRNNLPYSIGRNISVPIGQYPVVTLDGYIHISNGAAGYAGMVSALPVEQSSTNQPINISNLMYQLTNDQLNRLTKRGYVTFKPSYTKGTVVTDGITMETDGSPFKRLSITRITGQVEELIRAAVEPFIGTQNNLANRNSMQTAIKSSLDKIEGTLINKYEFRLVDDVQAERLGIIYIDYRLVPVYEIREVRNRIRVGHEI